MALDFWEDLIEFWPKKKRHSTQIWLEFKHNILTQTVLISNDLFIKRKGEQSQVLICIDLLTLACVVVFLCLELV